MATDLGVPPRQSAIQAAVTINVVRNQNTPFFINRPYAALIDQNLTIGSTVFQIEADDGDTKVS